MLLLLGACAAAASPPADSLRLVEVADVRLEIGVGSPIPIEVLVSGTWPDLCAQLEQTSMQVDGTSIRIKLAASELDPNCPPDFVGVPFRLAFPLNGVELPEGGYVVEVNGMTTTFTWPLPSRGGRPTHLLPIRNGDCHDLTAGLNAWWRDCACGGCEGHRPGQPRPRQPAGANL